MVSLLHLKMETPTCREDLCFVFCLLPNALPVDLHFLMILWVHEYGIWMGG